MGIFDFFKKKESKQKANLESSKSENLVDEAQEEFIQKATSNSERIVDGFGDKFDDAFDYSIDSLEVLDELLENFADFAEQMDEEMKSDLITQAGSYIFEVARRNYGGKYFWYDQLNQPILVFELQNN